MVCRGGANSTVMGQQVFLAHWMINAGFVVLCCDLGSPNAGSGLYGNDTVLARIEAAWTWAKANVAVKQDKFIIDAGSRGTVDAINYAQRNPSKVIALVAGIPVCDAEDVRANNRSNQQAAIEAAYTNNAGWQAARASRNPVEIAASYGATGIPSRFYVSSNDNVALPQYADQFVASASNVSKVDIGAQGHSTNGLNPNDVSDWGKTYA